MKEHWHPSIRLGDIIEKTTNLVERYLVPIDQVPGKIVKRVHNLESDSDKNPLIKIFLSIFLIKLAFTIFNIMGDQILGPSEASQSLLN
jgi:hypothetical protein